MAAELGIEYCGGINKRGSYCHAGDHRTGFVVDEVIHFADRPVTKASTYTFLKLVARPRVPDADVMEPWRRVYAIDYWARLAGETLRIRLPAKYWAADKAFVLAGVAGLSNKVPTRKQAFDWARR